jgi:hypothetical protein
MARRFVLGGAVLSGFGMYAYRRCTLPDAKRWLEAGPFESAIGYDETAQALSELTGVTVPRNRRRVLLGLGDEALVFRIVGPDRSWRPDRSEKGRLGIAYVKQHRELGLLTRKL